MYARSHDGGLAPVVVSIILVVAGREELYLNWFYQHSTYQQRGIAPKARAEYVAAYTGSAALRSNVSERLSDMAARQMAAALPLPMCPLQCFGLQYADDIRR